MDDKDAFRRSGQVLARFAVNVGRRRLRNHLQVHADSKLLILNAQSNWALGERLARALPTAQIFAVGTDESLPPGGEGSQRSLPNNLLELVAKPSQLPFDLHWFSAILVLPAESDAARAASEPAEMTRLLTGQGAREPSADDVRPGGPVHSPTIYVVGTAHGRQRSGRDARIFRAG